MKISEQELLQNGIEAIKKCLSDVPFLQIGEAKQLPLKRDLQADAILRVNSASKEIYLLLVAKNTGQPRVTREAINQLLLMTPNLPDSCGVVVAPFISEASAEICREAGVGYVDLSGNGRLTFDQVYIEKKGQRNIFAEKRDLRTLYSPKAERILRVLLENPEKRWKQQELEAEANVSLGLVNNVKRLLLDREWITVEKEGFYLNNPVLLLLEWEKNYKFSQSASTEYYSMDSVNEIERKIAEACRKEELVYAFTGFSAAARRAPHIKYQRVYVYVDGDPQIVANRVGLKTVSSGANVVLLKPYDEGLFYGKEKLDELTVVSSVQNYLDLTKIPMRGSEAAMFIFQTVLKVRWQVR